MSAAFVDYDTAIGGYRYIVLTTDAPIVESSHGGQHEEGWSRTYERWELDGDVVVYTCHTDGVDCDGRMTTTTRCYCGLANLADREVYESGDAEASESGPLPFRVPRWEHHRSRQRDYSAEAAGY